MHVSAKIMINVNFCKPSGDVTNYNFDHDHSIRITCRPVAKGGSLGAEEPSSLNIKGPLKSHSFVKNILYFVKKVHAHFVQKNPPEEVSGYGLDICDCSCKNQPSLHKN